MPELEAAVSATTRHRRQGEEDGREYWFLSDAEFVRRVAEGDFLEHVTYVSGKRYGTLRSEVDRIIGEGSIPVLELETEGALNVKDDVPGAVTIFITAPIPELERRLQRAGERERGRDRRAHRPRAQAARAGGASSTTSSSTTTSGRAAKELEEVVQRELVAAGTMSRP